MKTNLRKENKKKITRISDKSVYVSKNAHRNAAMAFTPYRQRMALRPVALHAISHINCEQHRTALAGLSDHYTYAGYVDFRAAFDCFSRRALWLLPTRLHVPDKSVRLIKAFYDKSGSCVRIYWRSPELVV